MTRPERPLLAAVTLPEAPEHLSARCRDLWAGMVSDWAFEAHQLELLRLALEALDRAEDARRVIDAEGAVYADARGFPRKHPAVAVEEAARIAAARLFRELALDVPTDARPPRRGGQRY